MAPLYEGIKIILNIFKKKEKILCSGVTSVVVRRARKMIKLREILLKYSEKRLGSSIEP